MIDGRIERLTELLAERSAKRGRFVLASGRESEFYVDARLTTMSPEGLSLIGPLALSVIADQQWMADSVGGLTLGADPISYAISYASAASSHPLRAFTVRKEPKGHGTGKLVEGPFREGDRVVVVEDVITSGGSAMRAASAVSAAGGRVLGILAVVDREEGGREALESAGYAVRSLTRARDILPLVSNRDR
jgi:orotate phosphoribosyltransferase